MGVRVKLNLNIASKEETVSALVNAGYESEECEVLLPATLAKKLQIRKGKKVMYHTAGGDVFFTCGGEATVKIITEDRESISVKAKLVISPYEEEVIINDKLAEELGIVFIKVKTGKWRFYDDDIEKIRESEPKQTW